VEPNPPTIDRIFRRGFRATRRDTWLEVFSMLDFPRWKVIWLWALTLACAAAALPSLASVAGLGWHSALPDPRINLGLDLAGGSEGVHRHSC
jgi:hypothetical protein